MKRIVVLGLMDQYPLGGMAWQVLHHLLGLRRLGYECYYVENSGAPPYSPRCESIVESASENIRKAAVQELIEHADVILNLCGTTLPDPDQRRKGCLVYIDTDPGFEQIHLAQGNRATRAYLGSHDVHFTYGWNVGETSSRIPSGGISWRKTHPPVVADLWDAPPGRVDGPWRTIATYRNKGKPGH